MSTVKEGGGVYVYKAVCLALGETSVTLRQVFFSFLFPSIPPFNTSSLNYGVGIKRWLSKCQITNLRWYKTSNTTKGCKILDVL